MRIALIHALRHSPPPIEAAFARLWPEACVHNLLDDSLSADLIRDGHLTESMSERFVLLATYAVRSGADGVLFTCSAFGPCIDRCIQELPSIPILKPNEAMVEEAARLGGRIGILASFEPTLRSMPSEFPSGLALSLKHVEGALPALDRGDGEAHDRLAADAADDLTHCDVIVLAQFSLARAAQAVAHRTGKLVLTTPDCAVLKLRRLLKA